MERFALKEVQLPTEVGSKFAGIRYGALFVTISGATSMLRSLADIWDTLVLVS